MRPAAIPFHLSPATLTLYLEPVLSLPKGLSKRPSPS